MQTEIELLIFLNDLANDPSIGWLKMSGSPKPLDVAGTAKKLFVSIAECNPLNDRDALLTKARRFREALIGANPANRIESWHPDYWSFVEAREVFSATMEVGRKEAA